MLFPAEHDNSVVGGEESILLVDDYSPIALLKRRVLEQLGYAVTYRTSSFDALNAFKNNLAKFDLVITDITRSDMTRDKLAGELLAIRPDLSILICTGYSEDIHKKNAKDLGIQGFLQKNVLKKELAEFVRNTLDNIQQKGD